MTTGRRVGRVEEIWLYPVRSLAGTAVPEAAASPDGLSGDRVWTAVGDDDRPLRAKETPAIREVLGTGDPDAAAAALTSALGRPVRLVPTPPERPGVAPVHLVSREAVDRAAAGEVPEGCSAEDPRANLVLALADPADDERSWVGRQLAVGGVLLEVSRTPKHCLGVYAQVRVPGKIAVGDAVLL